MPDATTAVPRYPTTLAGQFRRHFAAYAVGTLLLLVQQGLMYGRDRLFKLGVDAAVSDRGAEAVRAAGIAVLVVIGAATFRVLSRVIMFNGGRAAEYELRAS